MLFIFITAASRTGQSSVRSAACALLLGVIVAAPTAARASCGSSFCTLMTDRYALDGGNAHTGWSLDLRYEDITQDRLRNGSSKADQADIVGEEALEQHTRNRNLVTTLEYGINPRWTVLLRLPFTRREHDHVLIDEESGALGEHERWRFSEVADTQLLARRRFESPDRATSIALFGGLKLPTGSFDEENSEGERAERALQPGSGTTDLVAGASLRHLLGMRDALMAQAGITQALDAREHFEPGRRLGASVGWSHAITSRFGTVLQLNLAHRDRDQGAQAEPEVSGGTTLDFSPGVTVGIGHFSTLYAYVQLPLYQNVNGTQLVPHQVFATGWSRDF